MPRINKKDWKPLEAKLWLEHGTTSFEPVKEFGNKTDDEFFCDNWFELYDFMFDDDYGVELSAPREPDYYKSENMMIGDYMHHYISSKLLGENTLFHKSWPIPHQVTTAGELILKDDILTTALGVDVKVPHPHIHNKNLFYDVVIRENEQGNSGPEDLAIVDFKFINNLDHIRWPLSEKHEAQASLYLEAFEKKRDSFYFLDDEAGRNTIFYFIFSDGINTQTYSNNNYKNRWKKVA
tara:strand:- start:32 stop:742 length:711 start_codon:yes stop_codon:yes gene_type:complete